jgi:hypothetical protein
VRCLFAFPALLGLRHNGGPCAEQQEPTNNTALGRNCMVATLSIMSLVKRARTMRLSQISNV